MTKILCHYQNGAHLTWVFSKMMTVTDAIHFMESIGKISKWNVV